MYPVAMATIRKRKTMPKALTRELGSLESVVGVKLPPTKR